MNLHAYQKFLTIFFAIYLLDKHDREINHDTNFKKVDFDARYE